MRTEGARSRRPPATPDAVRKRAWWSLTDLVGVMFDLAVIKHVLIPEHTTEGDAVRPKRAFNHAQCQWVRGRSFDPFCGSTLGQWNNRAGIGECFGKHVPGRFLQRDLGYEPEPRCAHLASGLADHVDQQGVVHPFG